MIFKVNISASKQVIRFSVPNPKRGLICTQIVMETPAFKTLKLPDLIFVRDKEE